MESRESSQKLEGDMAAFLRRFLDYIEIERGLALNTVDAYSRDVTRYLEFLSDRNMDSPSLARQRDVEEFLHSLDCYVIQGFRYAKPMTPEDFIEWRKTRPWA